MLDFTLGSEYGRMFASLVAECETALWKIMAATISQDKGADMYSAQRYAEIATIRAELARRLDHDWEQVINDAQTFLDQAADAGQGMARMDLANAGLPTAFPEAMGLALSHVTLDAITRLTRLKPLVLREFVDVYQQVMAVPVTLNITGTTTRIAATEEALQRFAREGVTAFTDRGGRRWSLDAYAEMAVRTGSANAMREGWFSHLQASGQDLIIVSQHAYQCAKCAEWENKILSINGRHPPGRTVTRHATRDGQQVVFFVAGTVNDAKQAGLWHPNCEHTAYLYLPGVTAFPEPVPDLDTYEASQQQRALEVKIRAKKRELAASFLPESRTVVNSQIRGYQKQIRELLNANPKLTRKRIREQIKTAH